MSEIVIQYGYVTLFVVAFPLAPLMALLSCMFEMRVDGWKLVDHSQRPLHTGSSGLGMSTYIMNIYSQIAVLTNVALYTWRTTRVDELWGEVPANSTTGHKQATEDDKMLFFVITCAALFVVDRTLKFIIPDIKEKHRKLIKHVKKR
eukprot:UN04061